jgi:hypothetical protein
VSWSWTDEESFQANAAGRLVPEQREVLKGPPPGFSYFGLAAAILTPVLALALHGFGQNYAAITVGIIGAYVALTLFFVNGYERRQQRRLDAGLDHPTIQSGVGQVVPLGKGLEMRHGLARIAIPYDGPSLPAPGWYRIHWVEQTEHGHTMHRLLSIDPTPQPVPTIEPADVVTAREVMVTAMGSSMSELLANRAGVLTTKQRGSLRRGFVGRIIGVLCGLGIAYGFLWIMSYDIRSSVEDPWNIRIISIVPGLIALGALIAVGVTVRNMRRVTKALSDPTPVVRIEGPVVVREGDDTWELELGGVKYIIDAKVATTFAQPGTYALYHLPTLQRLLLAEPVTPAIVDV